MLKIRVLGCGTSTGVPVIGCNCPVCRSTNPRNQRLRSSIMISVDETNLLVDCSIDLRQQLLRWPYEHIDGVLMTHTHSDHVSGLDDLRIYNFYQGGALPFYTTAENLDDIRLRYHYCFNPRQLGGGVPQLALQAVVPGRTFEVQGVEILPLRIFHGELPILGYRVGDFAYLTDCSAIPEETEALLTGVDTLIVSGLRLRPHPTHFTIWQGLEAAQRLSVRRVYFTHMSDEVDEAIMRRILPEWAAVCYDGMALKMPYASPGSSQPDAALAVAGETR